MLDINEVLNSQTSKLNFIKGLIYIAMADGEIALSERSFFTQAAQSLGLNDGSVEEVNRLMSQELVDIELNFENKTQALFLLREGLQLCYMDGKYDVKEKDIIRKIAALTEISEDKIEAIEKWVVEGIEWSNRGEMLLSMEA